MSHGDTPLHRNSAGTVSTLARVLTVIVDATEADAVFDYVYAVAKVGRRGGGMVLMEPLLGAAPFELPVGVPDEES